MPVAPRPYDPSMAEMSMNKVIHVAFRRDLDRFVGALTTFRAGDTRRARQLKLAWDNFDHQLTDHHQGEHEIAWPSLESIGVTHETLVQMDAEHDIMAAALADARKAMASLASASGHGEAERALAAMERLREATVTHLDHEERELEQVYLDNEETPEMKEMGKKFARTSPAKAGVFFAWLLDAPSPQERAKVTDNVPAPIPVIKVLTAVFGRSYRKDVAPAWS